MTKIILVNGPPGSGKDTIGWDIMEWINDNAYPMMGYISIEKLALPLRKIVFALAEGELDIEQDKDKQVMFGGLTPRKIMQSASEDWLKRLAGPNVFAELLSQRIDTHYVIYDHIEHHYVVVTDCGFQTEVDYIVDKYGEDNVYLIRMMREGCNFIGDTREFTSIPKRSHFATITNNGSYDDLKSAAASVLSVWFGKKEAESD